MFFGRVVLFCSFLWFFIPLFVLHNWVGLLWLSLFFLRVQARSWFSFFCILLFGLQADILQQWPLGVGVFFFAVGLAAIEFLPRMVSLVFGLLFCALWLLADSSFTWPTFFIQVSVFTICLSLWQARRMWRVRQS